MRRTLFVVILIAGCSPTHHVADDTPADDTPGDDTPGDDVGQPDAEPGAPDAAAGPAPLAALDHPALVIVVGDSIAAGYNAANNNAPGGRGFARLVVDNHPAYPDYASRNIRALAADVGFRDLAESGATSDDAAARVHGALGGSLPAAVDGDVLVLINVGGNDFNDSIEVMLSPAATAAAAANLRANLADIVTGLRGRYDDPAAGKRAVFVIDTIHDPTDGLGTVPPQYDDGFCATIQNPLFTPELRQTALTNLGTMNTAIATEAAAQDAVMADVHAAFLGHGMNGAGGERWLSDDCAHPTSDGHHHLREAVWAALTTP